MNELAFTQDGKLFLQATDSGIEARPPLIAPCLSAAVTHTVTCFLAPICLGSCVQAGSHLRM